MLGLGFVLGRSGYGLGEKKSDQVASDATRGKQGSVGINNTRRMRGESLKISGARTMRGELEFRNLVKLAFLGSGIERANKRLTGRIYQMTEDEVRDALRDLEEIWDDRDVVETLAYGHHGFMPHLHPYQSCYEDLQARFYELNPDGAMAWFKKNDSGKGSYSGFEIEGHLLTGTFYLQPGRSFDRLMNLAKEAQIGEDGKEFDWGPLVYQLGRWSDDPIGKMKELDAVVSRGGSEGRLLAQSGAEFVMGLVGKGKYDSVSEMLSHLSEHGESVDPLIRKIDEYVLHEGLEVAKRKIENSQIPSGKWLYRKVMTGLAGSDGYYGQKAIDWLMSLEGEHAPSRSERILLVLEQREALLNEYSDIDQDPFEKDSWVHAQAEKWLNEMERRGESVAEGRRFLENDRMKSEIR